jgi:multiple sugar transport system substrate-binding protein
MLPQFDLYRRLEPFNMNWDVATYPIFKEAPGIGSVYDNIFINVTSTSKHQDDGMRVVEAVASSENQLAMSKYGFAPALSNPEIVKPFGVDQPALKGKHLEALFKIKGANSPELTKFDPIVRTELNNAMARIVNEGADVNTALRQAEESANSKIEADAK